MQQLSPGEKGAPSHRYSRGEGVVAAQKRQRFPLKQNCEASAADVLSSVTYLFPLQAALFSEGGKGKCSPHPWGERSPALLSRHPRQVSKLPRAKGRGYQRALSAAFVRRVPASRAVHSVTSWSGGQVLQQLLCCCCCFFLELEAPRSRAESHRVRVLARGREQETFCCKLGESPPAGWLKIQPGSITGFFAEHKSLCFASATYSTELLLRLDFEWKCLLWPLHVCIILHPVRW